MALDLETREQLIETVARFVAERLRPIEAKVAEDDAVPADIVEEMKSLGLFGLSIPEEFGGLGLNMEEEALVAVELGRASPAFRSVFGTNVGIGSQGLVMFGNDAQKAKWLPGIASGEIITSFALTEPEAGSDSAAVQTRAALDGDCYVLNGAKRYITNAGKASLFTVMARTNPDVKGGGGVSAFLVPRDLPGLSVLIGGMWIVNLNYWGCNQYITQRALGADLPTARKGLLFAAFLKLLMPVIIVLPGIAAFALDKSGMLGDAMRQGGELNPDRAYPTLLALLPALVLFRRSA